MARVLTSWKEIANYVGKAVRTVQRWEKDFGFPVRRTSNGSHHALLGIPEEIDAWIMREGRRKEGSDPKIESLIVEIVELRKENAALRCQLAKVESGRKNRW